MYELIKSSLLLNGILMIALAILMLILKHWDAIALESIITSLFP